MAVLSIRKVDSVALAAWKMQALSEGRTLRDWVITWLNYHCGSSFNQGLSPTHRGSEGSPGGAGRPKPIPSIPDHSKMVVVDSIPKKVYALPVRGTREFAYYQRYAKEKGEPPTTQELVDYMEEDA